MKPAPEPTSIRRRFSQWLSSPVRDVILARRTGRGLAAACLPARLMRSPLPTDQLVLIDKIARAVSLRPSEKQRVHDALISEWESAHLHGQPLSADLNDRRQRKRLVKRFRLERNERHPWDRRINYTVNFAMWSVLVFVIAFPLWVGTRQPRPSVDYLALLNANAAAIPETDRAWPGYREALLALSPHIDIHSHYGNTDPPQDLLAYGMRPGDPLWPAMRDFLTAHAEPLALIDEAARQPGLGFVLRSDNTYPADDTRALWGDEPPDFTSHFPEADRILADTYLPHLGPFRQLARLKSAEALAALEDRDAERFLELIQTLHGLSDHVSETPMMLTALTGISIDVLKLSLIEDLLRQDRPWLTDADLKRLADLLDGRTAFDLYRTEGEFMLARDMLQHSYTDTGRGNGHLTRHGLMRRIIRGYPDADDPPELMHPLIEAFGACFFRFAGPNRRELSEWIDTFEHLVQEDLNRPLWATGPGRAEVFLERAREDFVTSILCNFFLPPTHSRSDQLYLAEVKRGAMAAAVGLERYRRSYGDWPPQLALLVPEYLAELPLDPADGQVLRYAVREGRQLLYSLGADGDDDGGHWPMTEDDDWRYGRHPEKPAEPIMIEDNHSASRFTDDADSYLVDGDWVLFPSPVDPPAELPDPDQSLFYGNRITPFGNYGAPAVSTPDEE